ncbi:hypothetical protein RvY_10730 [Ramazzottius varieornatus]|uniref:Replication termination factor 2 n=1 Tax=Ramazzottius varieornatus TaxID=947166 RepID=A0A1D1VMQ3_RAMVA|nr:hypothetical protein RvY_10730 [Ramazzottius varieornatus]
MGNDGGTIPRRIELVREKKRVQKVDKDAEVAAKWKYCQISQEPLRPPVMADDLGRLYNKDSVLQHLIEKKSSAGVAEHIKSMKDVKELTLTERRQDKKIPSDEGGFQKEAQWICPVTGLEMSGRQLFSFVRNCGCVISDRALKALKSETCPNCNEPYSADHIIPLNPGPEDLERLKARMELLKNQQRAEKEAAKAKKRALETSEENSTSGSTSKRPTAATIKLEKSEASTSKIRQTLHKDKEVEELVKKSIAEDPTASTTFKNLFTTCETAKSRKTSNWVTYNPYY